MSCKEHLGETIEAIEQELLVKVSKVRSQIKILYPNPSDPGEIALIIATRDERDRNLTLYFDCTGSWGGFASEPTLNTILHKYADITDSKYFSIQIEEQNERNRLYQEQSVETRDKISQLIRKRVKKQTLTADEELFIEDNFSKPTQAITTKYQSQKNTYINNPETRIKLLQQLTLDIIQSSF